MTTIASNPANATSSRLFRVFADRKINTKIGLGFACVLLIMTGISVMANIAFNRISVDFAEFNRLVDVVANARAVDRSFIELRRFVREYAVSGDEGAANEAQKRRQLPAATIEEGRKIANHPQRAVKLGEIAEQFEMYTKDFDKLLALRHEETRLTKEVLDPTGANLRGQIEQLQTWAVSKAGNSNATLLAGEAIKHLMLARLKVNKLLGRHEASAAQGAEAAFADLRIVMTAIGTTMVNDEVRRLLTEVNANVEKYAAAFKAAAHNAHEIERLVNGEMAKGANAIAAGAASTVESGVADEKAIEQDTETLLASVERLVSSLAIAGLVLGAALAWVVGRGISRPIQSMTRTITELARGDLKVMIPAQDNKDEIGDMAKAVVVFRNAAVEKTRLERETEAQQQAAQREREAREAEKTEEAKQAQATIAALGDGLGRLAQGDLLCRIERPFVPNFEKLRSDFNAAVDKLKETILAVVSSTQAMDAGTQEISTASNDLSRRTEQQASSLEETAAALDQVTATVKKAAEGATHARKVVAGTRTDAEKSGEVVRKAVEAMGGIAKSSQQISQIIGVIDEIAFQTNLLALNAGVEAARAGDAGRGFAVVASEVRALARRSAEAAKEIKGLIATSSAQVGQGVELVAETGKSLHLIATKVGEIDTVVTDIAAGAQEQATGLQQVNTAINQMDKVTQQNAAMAEEATAASRSLSRESAELSKLVSLFKVGDTPARIPARRTAGKSEPVRSTIKSAEPGRADPQTSRRQLKTPAGRNGAAAVRKIDTACQEEGWQDF
jgi:methyl-accepting chemotaxis protein